MTVRDLIAQLSALDPDTPVLVYETGGEGMRCGYRDAGRLATVRVAPRQAGGFYPQFRNLPGRNTVNAVCLE